MNKEEKMIRALELANTIICGKEEFQKLYSEIKSYEEDKDICSAHRFINFLEEQEKSGKTFATDEDMVNISRIIENESTCTTCQPTGGLDFDARPWKIKSGLLEIKFKDD